MLSGADCESLVVDEDKVDIYWKNGTRNRFFRVIYENVRQKLQTAGEKGIDR